MLKQLIKFIFLICAIVIISQNKSNAQVKSILLQSADKVGGYSYTNGKSIEFGYGRLNAFKAVMLACAFEYDIEDNFESDEDIHYTAADNIVISSDVSNNATVEVSAGSFVRLTNGFHAMQGSDFHSYIDGCNEWSTSKLSADYVFNEENTSHNVFPNPASEFIEVDGVKLEDTVELVNILGESFMKVFVKETPFRIQINSKIPKGFYTLIIKSNGNYSSRNVIIN